MSHSPIEPEVGYARRRSILLTRLYPLPRLRLRSRLVVIAAVFAILLLGMTAALIGCGSSSDQVTIRFWNGFTGPDGRAMLRMIKRFNAENPDIHILMQRMDWPPYYNKLFVAGLGGRAPEVFVIHAANIERFLQARFVRPLDDLVTGPDGIDTADFADTAWEAVRRGGAHYGVPLDVHPVGMYYNKTLLKRAGVVDARGEAAPPTTAEEFLDATLKVAALPASGEARKNWGYVFTWLRTNIYTIMRQYGGQFFTDPPTRCVMNCPENVAALEFCVALIRTHKVVPPPENFDSWVGFLQGRVGIAFEGIYMLADLKKQTDLDWGAAPLPMLGRERAAWADSHVLCLRADIDERHRDAAWRFIKFLSDNSLDWAEGGQIPARTSLRETERFRAMYAQNEFSRQLPYITYLPPIPFIFEFQTEFDTAVEKALRGSVSARQALDDATRNINEILERRRAMLAGTEP